jgi:hypothetical protein
MDQAGQNADRFRKIAQECRVQAKATSPLDREAWLRLAEDWGRNNWRDTMKYIVLASMAATLMISSASAEIPKGNLNKIASICEVNVKACKANCG